MWSYLGSDINGIGYKISCSESYNNTGTNWNLPLAALITVIKVSILHLVLYVFVKQSGWLIHKESLINPVLLSAMGLLLGFSNVIIKKKIWKPQCFYIVLHVFQNPMCPQHIFTD